ncbi:MAG: DUF1566 domain-containing protein [Chlorobaculum sp.]|nr:DUF1566 domain-containing protein [Chlorobaculum sp.]
MSTVGYPLFRRLYSIFATTTIVVALTTPVTPRLLDAAEPASATSVAASLKIGDLYGGGKVAYLFQPGDAGYVAGQSHGLIAATADIGEGMMWAKAVKLCKEYRGGGFSDWRLPSKEELNRLYKSKALIGSFKERHFYWSGTDSDKNDAWDQSFRTGICNLGYKLDNNYVRAVRAF